MENLLLALLPLGVMYFALRASFTTRKNTRKFKKKLRPNIVRKKRGSFDAKSAKHLPASRILRGSAYIIDGDTIVIKKTQIRLFGIDAPELNHPYGQKAKWALVSLCKGQILRAELIEVDAYGRAVAKCFLRDGRDVSAEMVKLGLAIEWAKFSDGSYGKLETPDARKKLWLADARQKGRMHVWRQFETRQAKRKSKF